MSMRFTFGILALTGLFAATPAAIVSYKISGTFATATGSVESLANSGFTYEFSYDTEATGTTEDETTTYAMKSAKLTTNLGTESGFSGVGVTTGFGGGYTFATSNQGAAGLNSVFGLSISPERFPTSGALPTSIESILPNSDVSFYYLALDGTSGSNITGLATTENLSIEAVPEPASLAALAVGGVGLLRRRRTHA